MSEDELLHGTGECRPQHGEGDEPAAPEGASTVPLSTTGYTFDTVVGFDSEIRRLREAGIIAGGDSAYLEFVEQMRRQHGLYDEPVGTAVLFRSDVREDADRLMLACANELGRPTARLRVVDAPGDSQALCIMSTPGITEEGFEDWGTLVIEGIDAIEPPDGFDEGLSPFGMAMRLAAMPGGVPAAAGGALKALGFIRAAAANPRVAVFASACVHPDDSSPIMRLLGPMRLFEVPVPDPAERDAIWDHLMDKHVSMSALDRPELVRLSAGMPRCDIFAAAREAVVQAYRQSLDQMSYVPVTRGNLLDKIAAYQPLDSAEYQEIEESIVEDFLADLERYEHGCR